MNHDNYSLSELLEMSERQTQQCLKGPWIRISRLAEIWGVSESTIKRLISEGELLTTEIRGCRVISVIDASRYLERQLRKTTEKNFA